MDRVLIVEDVDSLRDVLSAVLEREGYTVVACGSAEEALEAFKQSTFSLVLSDFKLPEMTGIDLLRSVRKRSANVPFLLMTAFGSIDMAVEAMKEGANDFIAKPFEPSTLVRSIKEIIAHRRIVDRSVGLSQRRERSLLTASENVEKVLAQATKVARVDSSVLILGESGTGKELLARHIHEHSPRKDKPFVAVNCGAMPSELLESEFFGHEAGAFTGATQGRIGLFEFASEGTIFLDELGDMPRPLQVKLLRALQEHEIKRVGSNKSIKVNPRIIAATNLTLEEILDGGSIREDLYYRIAVVTLSLPALVKRPNDVELLVKHFCQEFSSSSGRPAPTIDETAWDLLRRYRWPGNARELENVIERAVLLADDVIRPEHLGITVRLDFDALMEATINLHEIAEKAAREAEIEMIVKVLGRTDGNKSRAAQLLGVSYKTLLNKVKEYQLASA